jgi:hypothetical protein|tara:strand:+ start:1245 stop:1526 length:282 start_codon:yes stop_codon:yes gene_type:complete
MPNTQAKERKRRRVRINAELKSNGRTRRQINKKKKEQAIAEYEKKYNTTITPAKAFVDIRYQIMHQEIATKNKIARDKAEAEAEANRNSKEGE